ncbi:helicase HerA domain-containing protein, partial [Crocosphaera chwakensis]
MFITDLKGILINLKEDNQTRYQCEIWFDYTRKYMEQIREGAFLAAPNFSSNSHGYRYTILEVVSILPIHYGLGENVKGYPGFVKEAAKSAFSDWKQQEDEVREDTTQIRIIAIPTNYEVNKQGTISDESNLPMSGCDVYFIDNELTKKIANLGIDPERDNIIKAGHLIREKEIETYVLIEELLQVHFGIFGFTGAGKSNLLSTLIAKLFQERTIKQDPLKVVFFDLMSEYTTLALDILIEKDAYLIGLGEQTFPGEVIEYLSGKQDKLQAASEAMAKTTLLPKALKKYRESLTLVYRQLLEDRKILVYQKVDISKTLGTIVKELWQQYKDKQPGNIGADDPGKVKNIIQQLIQNQKPLLENDKKSIEAILNNAQLGKTGKKWIQPLFDNLFDA